MTDPEDPGATIPMQRTEKATVISRAGGSSNPDAELPYLFGPEIARGGMGSILEAEDCKLPRTVAVKIILSEIDADDDQKQRFMNEAAVLARLAHPNIVPVYDIGRDSAGQLYYSMKLVKGRTLQSIINDLRKGGGIGEAILPASTSEAGGRMPLPHYTLERLLTIFRKVCDAMAFAHSQGIIHRDLKPENVMVGEFGEVLVMDWGLAKTLRDEGGRMKDEAASPGFSSFSLPSSSLSSTLDGSVMGTPQYMSPEQAKGLVDELDARSDIFSLGSVLYCILTLRPPVEGKTLDEVLQKVASGGITPPSAFNASTGHGPKIKKGDVLEAKLIKPLPHIAGGRVPSALSSVVMKALAPDKAQRYQSVAEFSADIEAYQAGFATKAEHAGLAKQLVLLIKRNKGIFTTAAAAWLLITALGIWFVINLRAKEQRALAGEQSAKAAEAVALREKEAARQSLARAALNLAEAAQREGNGPEMQAALNDVPDDLRDSTWRYLLDQADTSIARIRTGDAEIVGVVAQPRQAGVFVVADGERKITVLKVRTGEVLQQFEAGLTRQRKDEPLRIAVSPDGERVAIGRRAGAGGIVVHSTRDGKKLAGWDAPNTDVLAFSPDGGLLLQAQGGGASSVLRVWDSASGELRWKYEPASGFAHGAFTNDGQQVLTAGYPDGLRLVSAHDGTLVRQVGGERQAFVVLALGAKGLFAVQSIGREVMLMDLKDGAVINRFKTEVAAKAVTTLAWTPDGGNLVTAWQAADGRQVIQLRNPLTASVERSLLGGSGNIPTLSIHPLSGELALAGRDARAWSLTGAREKWILPKAGVASLSFFGSDDVIFAGLSATSSAVQKLQPGDPVAIWKVPSKGYRYPSVSADGRFAAIGEEAPATTILMLRRAGETIEQVSSFPMTLGKARLRLSPDGAGLIAFDRTGKSRQFATATGEKLPPLDQPDIVALHDVGWLAGGQRLVGLATFNAERLQPGSEERVVLWDSAAGKIVQTATNRTAMDVLAVAPDGSRFAEAGADKKVRIRDAATLAVVQEFRAHDGPITALAWHPTRPIVATASTDLSIHLWDLDTGRQLEELRGPVNAPKELSFSPSGHLLGCAVDGDVMRIWEPESLK